MNRQRSCSLFVRWLPVNIAPKSPSISTSVWFWSGSQPSVGWSVIKSKQSLPRGFPPGGNGLDAAAAYRRSRSEKEARSGRPCARPQPKAMCAVHHEPSLRMLLRLMGQEATHGIPVSQRDKGRYKDELSWLSRFAKACLSRSRAAAADSEPSANSGVLHGRHQDSVHCLCD